MSLNISLEQARALDALAQHGTYQRAAETLRKRHAAVVYAIRNLEQQTGLVLLDRTGYRTRLTDAGQRVLVECRRMLSVERDLEVVCHTIRTGWEPRLGIVFDGVYPAPRLLGHVSELVRERVPTRIDATVEFLSRVEATFFESGATLMISVLPPLSTDLVTEGLAPIVMHLVASSAHPIAKRRRVTTAELRDETLITVRGGDPRLRLPTSGIDSPFAVHLHDFVTKRDAILEGLGYGWLPGHLAESELRRKRLRHVAWDGGNTFRLTPSVCYRRSELGRAATTIVNALRGRANVAPAS